MINKIGGNGYYDYAKPKKMNIANTGEKFSLGDKKDGLQAEAKDKNEVSGQEKQQAAERDGVRIELSGEGVEKQKQAEAVEHPNASGRTSLLETIRTFFTAAVAAVKDIFSKIWNDPQREDDLKDILEDPEREIQKCLQDGDLDQVIRLLTDNGRKTAARNSTLLTFYDRNRRVVKLDVSVQQRALYGDRNTLEL